MDARVRAAPEIGLVVEGDQDLDVAPGAAHEVDGLVLEGIQLRDAIRYAPGNDRGWYQLYVGNAWGLFRVHARVESTDAEGNPIFARCR